MRLLFGSKLQKYVGCLSLIFLLARQLSWLGTLTRSVSTPSLILPQGAIPLSRRYDEKDLLKNMVSNFRYEDKIYDKNQTKPLVAIVLCSSSKGTKWRVFNQTALAKFVIPSLLNTLELGRYRYALFVGVNDDDRFWSNKFRHRALKKQIGNKFLVQIHSFPSKANHIPFNEISKVAYDNGADYFMRINDDTEFNSAGWTTLGIAALRNMDPPNVGVVGPTFTRDSLEVLSHDMVHRKHMLIFEQKFYPSFFENQYMDDWISLVYGPHRTKKLEEWTVKTRTKYQKHRHQPKTVQDALLEHEVNKGKVKIATWLGEKVDPKLLREANTSYEYTDIEAQYKSLLEEKAKKFQYKGRIHDKNETKPKIAIVLCATAKGTEWRVFNETAMAKLMLPSLLKTMELDRYRYSLYIGIDDDDRFWANTHRHRALEALARDLLPVHIHSFPPKENRIPFNPILKVAFRDGADYIVRINDDTEFESRRWTTFGISALQSMDPPNVGVVGPTFNRGNLDILTHDMVHRKHMHIFHEKYYPKVFKNWYIDDWISLVYGANRTKKLEEWTVIHHTKHQKRRYKPSRDQEELLDQEVKKGKLQITEWLLTHPQGTKL